MTSSRSSSAGGMVSTVFAVTIQNTEDRSKGYSTKWSLNAWFCSGSKASNKAAAGSPRKSLAILSTSSSKNRGFRQPTFCMPWINRPGIAPIYVRRCPRISASSRTPPRETRVNFRFTASAMDSAKEVLPTPGGPTRHKIGAFFPFVSFCTARCSRIRSFTLTRP